MRACLDDSVPGHPRRRVQAQPLRRASCVSPRAAAARSVGRTPRHPRGRQPLTVSTAASIGGGARPVVPRPPGVLVRRPSVDALAPALHQRRRRCPRRRVRDSGPPIQAAHLSRHWMQPRCKIQNCRTPLTPPLDASTLRPTFASQKYIHKFYKKEITGWVKVGYYTN